MDDPTTHLELTMIHEVMVLDHSGPDFAYIQYAAALKLWILGALFVGLVVVPLRSFGLWLDGAAALLGMAGLAVAIGIVESAMARYRLVARAATIVGARRSRLSPSSCSWSERNARSFRHHPRDRPGQLFRPLGTSRIGACIRWLSLQGIVFGLVPLITHDAGLGLCVMLLAGGNIAIEGDHLPWVLLRLRARTPIPARSSRLSDLSRRSS